MEYYECLEGISASFIGDSLFGGHSLGKEPTWIGLLSRKYKMNAQNYGLNGCTLSACEGGANPIVVRYSEMEDNDPDIVVFEGGRNDYNKGAQLGDVESGDKTTFKGALGALVQGLREKYPRAVIIGVTFWKVNPRENTIGLPCSAYTDAMLEVCRELSVPCIDATAEEETLIAMTDPEFRREFSLVPGDVCHLNERGMERALPFFERRIAEIYSEIKKK